MKKAMAPIPLIKTRHAAVGDVSKNDTMSELKCHTLKLTWGKKEFVDPQRSFFVF